MARKPKQRIDPEKVQEVVRDYLKQAVAYQQDTLKPRWDRAGNLYDGDVVAELPVTPENDERSQFMSRDVHDTVSAMLPELVNVFLSDDDNVIHYRPNRPTDVAGAELATQYVNFLIRKFGTRAIIDAMHDAMVLGLGAIKVSVVEQVKVVEKTYAGLTPMEFEALTTPPDAESEGMEGYNTGDKVEIEVVEHTEREEVAPLDPMLDPMNPMSMPVPQKLIDAKVKVITRRKVIGFVPLPPEERLIIPSARDLETAKFAAHCRKATINELVGMGYSEEDFEDISGDTFVFLDDAQETRSRDEGGTSDTPKDPGAREVIYSECYVIADFDGDGVASRYKVCTAGANGTVVKPEGHEVATVVEEVPWAELCPWPVPHSATGNGAADRVGDIQISNTVLFRALFDSLGQTMFPPRAYNENAVVDDRQLLNTGPGVNIAFTTSPEGQVKELTREFQGQAIMPVVALMSEIRENRTGVSKAAAGLNPDALQSTTKAAVAATVSKAEAQTMLVARNFASGFERLGKLVLKAMVSEPASVDMMQLSNGKWQEVDPAAFDPDMSVYVDTARGRGDKEERAATLQASIEFQIQALLQKSKLTDEQKLYNAIYDRMRMVGVADPTRYYTDPSTLPPEPPQPPQPDPMMIAAMAEADKAKYQGLDAMLSGISKLLDTVLSDDRDRDKNQLDYIAKMSQIQATSAVQAEEGQTARLAQQSSIITERARDYMGFLGQALKLVQAVKQSETAQQPAQVEPAAPPGPPAVPGAPA